MFKTCLYNFQISVCYPKKLYQPTSLNVIPTLFKNNLPPWSTIFCRPCVLTPDVVASLFQHVTVVT